jgi:transposase
MARKRRKFSPQFMLKVALEALKGQATVNEIASQYQVHPNQVRSWKKKLVENGALIYQRIHERAPKGPEEEQAKLHEQIEQLKIELAWLKTKVNGMD